MTVSVQSGLTSNRGAGLPEMKWADHTPAHFIWGPVLPVVS